MPTDLRNTKYGDAWRSSRKGFHAELARTATDIAAIYAIYARALAKTLESSRIDDEGRLTVASSETWKRTQKEQIAILATALVSRIGLTIDKSFTLASKPIIDLAAGTFGEIAQPAKIRAALESITNRAAELYKTEKRFGFTYSERVWRDAGRTSQKIQKIVSEALAEGRDCVKVAKDLEKYIISGKSTLSKNYPNMMRRMGGRVPGNVSYEALRLARTEASYAFNQSTIEAAAANPACVGIGFRLSNSHPEPDICDTLAKTDGYGLGPGNYPIGEAPGTQHPCCLCFLVPLTRNMVPDIERWKLDPSSEPVIDALISEANATAGR